MTKISDNIDDFDARGQKDSAAKFRPGAPARGTVSAGIEADAELPMQRSAHGQLGAAVSVGTWYRYQPPNGMKVPDPASNERADDVYDAGVAATSSLIWKDANWGQRAWTEIIRYEVHLAVVCGYRGLQVGGLRVGWPRLKAVDIKAAEVIPNNAAAPLGPAVDRRTTNDGRNAPHVLLTNGRDDYHGDHANEPAVTLACALAEGWVDQGNNSSILNAPRGEPSPDLLPYSHVLFLQDDDQSANLAFDERLTTLTSVSVFEARTEIYMLSPQNWPLRKQILDQNSFRALAACIPRHGIADRLGRYQRWISLRYKYIVHYPIGLVSPGAEAIRPKAVLARWKLIDRAKLTITTTSGIDAVSFRAPPRRLLFTTGNRLPMTATYSDGAA